VRGRRTALIEDVITTGGAVSEAAALLRAAGAEVIAVVCAIWRADGPPRIIDLPDVPILPALTRADLRAASDT
jgi:orotate phosphoribosyltransferase